MSREPKTTLPADLLRSLNEQIVKVPDDFTVHRKLGPLLEKRREEWRSTGPTRRSWTSLALGVPIRLTGQDTRSPASATWNHDAKDGRRWCPLQHLQHAVSPLELHNSPLSEQ